MNQRRRFIRKVVYACAIAVLLLPISWLSRPEITDRAGQLQQGGQLASMRHQYRLSQASLGEIDPASETIRLAMLGLNGIAANILWEKANYYKKVEDWTSLMATLEQITKLQRNFLHVWEFQAWNLSYNVSTEFDDYRDRYYWVMRGINFLKQGIRYNVNEPRLMKELGWVIAQKIGRADEHKQFRKMFKADDDFHNADTQEGGVRRSRSLAARDNWLVGREKFLQAEDLVDRRVAALKVLATYTPLEQQQDPAESSRGLKGMNPLVFYSHSAMCLMNYAEALEDEGTFGEVAKRAWEEASRVWKQYSDRDMATSYDITIRLSDKEIWEQRAKDAWERLERLVPKGTREKIREAHMAAHLSQEEQELLKVPPDRLTQEQQGAIYLLANKLKVSPTEVAKKAPSQKAAEALQAAADAIEADERIDIIANYRDQVNFDYWKLRCLVEASEDTLAARQSIAEARKEHSRSRLDEANNLFEAGFSSWRKVLDKYPALLAQSSVLEDLWDVIDRYRRLLADRDEEFPANFILQDVEKLRGGQAPVPLKSTRPTMPKPGT